MWRSSHCSRQLPFLISSGLANARRQSEILEDLRMLMRALDDVLPALCLRGFDLSLRAAACCHVGL